MRKILGITPLSPSFFLTPNTSPNTFGLSPEKENPMSCLIREKKSGIYYIVSNQGGKRVWKSTRTRDKKEAYQVYLIFSKEISKSKPRNLSSCIQEYMQYAKTNFASKTQDIYKLTLDHLLAAVGDIDVGKITTLAIEQYKNQRAEKVKAATVNIELRTMNAFFNCLKRWEIVTKNPCDGVRQIRIADVIPAYLSLEQLKSLLESMKDPWLKEIVIFAVMTGTRLGEITNVKWDDVNLINRMITIRSSNAYQVKGGKLRVIPMNETLVRLLEAKEPKQGIVFKGKRGGRANGNFVSENFREAIRKNGFDRRLHFHSLRHTFASLLVTNGTSLYQVQRLLGHSSTKMTEIYAHLQGSGLQNVVETIAV